MSRKTQRLTLLSYNGSGAARRRDALVVEEPLEIRLQAGGQTRTVAVTMRTPGDDYELAAGFLFSAGVVAGGAELLQMTYCVDAAEEQTYNSLAVQLRGPSLPELPQLDRHFFTNSACGVCGQTFIDELGAREIPPLPAGPTIAADLLYSLPARLAQAQPLFDATGGLHAAALFTADGTLLQVREDVGRHNALDKLIGWALLNDRLPLHDHVLLVSGRASFELLQKAALAGIPLFCAVSAPSTLAVAVARRFGLTLVGFLRQDRANVYTGEQRIHAAATTPAA